MIHTPNTVNDFADSNDHLFAQIAMDIKTKGYSINPEALPISLGNNLIRHLGRLSEEDFVKAGIGRDRQLMRNNFVRGDEICWITSESKVGRAWLNWTGKMQVYLNRQLFLGLFSFESHFAHYAAGDFYKRHFDSFKGEANRVLSLVVYLNPTWVQADGGELVLFTDKSNPEGIKVAPGFRTVVIFLSDDFPHEVRVTHRDRYSIAGWFRINSSTTVRVGPAL